MVQFHPDVMPPKRGGDMLRHFLFDVCSCTGDWQMASFVEDAVCRVRRQIGDKKVLCGLSGGVDSSVAVSYTHLDVYKRQIKTAGRHQMGRPAVLHLNMN